jgi:Tol biopolymer transport system component
VATVDVSTDGRLVAFVSLARLTAEDDNTVEDIYVLDRATAAIRLESATVSGAASVGSSQHPRLSGDGRVLVFSTLAAALVGPGVETAGAQVVRRDRSTGALTLVSHTPTGTPGNGWSGVPDVSDDGRFVVFESRATDLVAGPDHNHGGSDIYLFDAADGGLRRVSVPTVGEQPAAGQSGTPAISGTGRFIAFSSTAPLDTPPGRTDARPVHRDVFVRDVVEGVTRRVSASRNPRGPDGDSYHPAISGDGHRIAFVSTATNLDADARAGPEEHVYLAQLGLPRLTLLSRTSSGRAADGPSRYPAFSADGRYVLFSSEASNLHYRDRCGAAEDLNLVSDVYRVDAATGVADRISGAVAREPWWTASQGVASDGSGRVVAFSSREPMDDDDLGHDDDLFIVAWPEAAAAGAASAQRCAPGVARSPPE